jgi:membrane protease YdiL (CAAX protease family)
VDARTYATGVVAAGRLLDGVGHRTTEAHLSAARHWRPRIGAVSLGGTGSHRAALLMVLAGMIAGTLHGLYGPNSVLYHSVGYALWAIEQEFILQSFFYVNVEQLAGNRFHSAVIATALFAAAHFPNPVLVSATLVVGICFTQLFRRYRNIYALGIAHGLLGLALAVSVSADVHHHMRVGLGYRLYRPNPAAPAPSIFELPQR